MFVQVKNKKFVFILINILFLGGDQQSNHSLEVDYLKLLPTLFELHVSNFYLQLSSESDRERALACISKHMQPWHRVFIGVTNPINARIETPEEVCDQILEAVKYIPIEQLGTTDDCGFSPFADDQLASRQIAFDKIRARVEGTRMAEEQLMMKKQKKI
jgi:5-methyltetrahydropteroyltriglutamate--homocysteine methyltransferase